MPKAPPATSSRRRGRPFLRLPPLSPWIVDALLLTVPLALYLHLALWRLDLPGLSGEEVHTLFPALSWLLDWEGKLLLLAAYHGPYESFLAAPFLVLFGHSAATIRVCAVFYAALTIVAAYWLMRRLSGSRWPAAGSALLLALSPGFVIGTRVGMQKGVMMPLLALLAMAFTSLWLEKRRKDWFLLAAAAWALTAGCRIWSLTLLAAWAASLAMSHPGAIKDLRRRRADLSSALMVFAVILLTPYLIDNVRNNPPWHTVQGLLERHSGPERTLWQSLLARLKDFQWHLGGIASFHEQAVIELKEPLETALRAEFSTWLFWAAVLGAALALWRPWKGSRPLAFLGPIAPLTILLLAFSKGGNRLDHVHMLYPFAPLVLMAALFAGMAACPRSWRFHGRVLCAALLAVVLWEDARLLRAYRAYLSEVGGFGEYSSALTDLADFVRARGFRRVYFPRSEPAMRMSLAFQNDWKVEIASADFDDILDFDELVAREDDSTAFVQVNRWRSHRRYPLSAALRRYAKKGAVARVPFQSRPKAPEFTLYYRE